MMTEERWYLRTILDNLEPNCVDPNLKFYNNQPNTKAICRFRFKNSFSTKMTCVVYILQNSPIRENQEIFEL